MTAPQKILIGLFLFLALVWVWEWWDRRWDNMNTEE